jgi:pyruvate ferredoxin oxidoreductase gamma subunit
MGEVTDGAAGASGETRGVFQVRFHGRGGQGVVTAAETLSIAAFAEGRHAQAFPTFGSERTGAPVIAFCRIADEALRTREPVSAPDALVVQDPTLLHQVDLFNGLVPDGYVVINSTRSFEELGLTDLLARFRRERMLAVPATDLAREHVGRPIPNAAMLGALAGLTGVVSIDSIAAAIHEKFKGSVAAGNGAAARAAFDFVARKSGERVLA